MTDRHSDPSVLATAVLILSDDPISLRLLRQILQHRGYRTRDVRSPAALRAAIAQQRPDLILLDVVTPSDEVYELCRELSSGRAAKQTTHSMSETDRAVSETSRVMSQTFRVVSETISAPVSETIQAPVSETAPIPILFVSAFQQVTDKVRAFAEGCADYLTKPFQPAEVLARIEHHLKLARLQRELEREKAELARSYSLLASAHRRLRLMSGVVSEHLTGERLDGKYLLEQKIDSGGFGVVYRAHHLGLQRPVAVKILRLLRPEDAERQIERFRREGALACRVNHPNAITILDSGVSPEGIPYLVMELLSGHSLLAHLARRGGQLPVEECPRIIEPVCEVLIEAHAAGVIHRDIKPENIFLHRGPQGEVVKVLDFGIAELRGLDEPALTRLTHPDSVIGTALYMAPERLRGAPSDGRSDVYSVAVMLHEMLYGHPPSAEAGAEHGSLPSAHAGSSVPDLKEPVIPAELAQVVRRGLAKDPLQRPTAREFLAGLRVSWRTGSRTALGA